MSRIDILVKTLLGMEKLTASRIEELSSQNVKVEATAKPEGYLGLVAVKVEPPEESGRIARLIEAEIPEAERVLPALKCVSSELEEIVEAAVEAVSPLLKPEASFAVRTVRRGRQPYTSLDVNVRVGSALTQATGAQVNLTSPDMVVWVEILGSKALVGVMEGSKVWRKAKPGKKDVRGYLTRVALVQMPYLGPPDACKTMGSRIGRAVQTFEVGELIIGYVGSLDARALQTFLSGLFEGLESRYQIQLKTYAHKPRRVPVFIQDLYQLVRERRDEPIIVLEPEGEPLPKAADRLAEIFLERSGRVNMLVGSREGIPKGVFRMADLILDVCPGVTISTDYAAASALIALANALEWKLLEGEGERSPS